MIFDLQDLKKATNDFAKESLIGKGGFGHVYRKNLRRSAVAVKVLNDVCECCCECSMQVTACATTSAWDEQHNESRCGMPA